jgi:hypothetical protein
LVQADSLLYEAKERLRARSDSTRQLR